MQGVTGITAVGAVVGDGVGELKAGAIVGDRDGFILGYAVGCVGIRLGRGVGPGLGSLVGLKVCAIVYTNNT